MVRRYAEVAAFALLLASAGGCDKAEKPKEEKSSDAGAAKPATVDKELAEAVEAVAGGEGLPGAGGPPPNGVFASPVAADKEMPAGAPPKISVGGKGSPPLVTFAAPKPGRKVDGVVEVAVQTGPRSAMPTIDLAVSIETPAAKTEGDAPAAPSDARVRVMNAKLAEDQPGDLPPGVAKEIAKMKGSEIKVAFAPTGAGTVTGIQIAKENEETFGQIVRSAGDALAVEFLPYPSEPVGVGAFWLVTTRESFFGLDVVAYRMIKLEKVDGERATLSVNTKRYMAGGRLAVAGLPPHAIVELNAPTKGAVEVSTSNPSVLQGEFTDTLLAGVSLLEAKGPGPGPGQRSGIQLQVRSRIVIGKP